MTTRDAEGGDGRAGSDTLPSSLGEVLGVEGVEADDLYDALDPPVAGQARTERKLARRHLEEGRRVLRDATAVPFESRTRERQVIVATQDRLALEWLSVAPDVELEAVAARG